MTDRPRRQYGTGHVTQRANGRWYGYAEAGWTEQGTRRRRAVTAPTEAECKRRLKVLQRDLDRDGFDTAERATVKSWSDQWLAMQATMLRPKTYDSYASIVRRWLVPTIGRRRLDQLTPGDIRAVADAHRQAGRSTTSALKAHAVLMAMLRAALIEGHQVPPRALAVKRPRKAISDRTALTMPEAVRILEAASHLPHGSRWAAALVLGMRQGECLGLTWSHVDLDTGIVDVSWQLQSLRYLNRKAGTFRVPDGFEARRLTGAHHLVRPKTERGQRLIPLVAGMRQTLAVWRQTGTASPHDLVWPDVDGQPRTSEDDRDEWHRLQVTAGVQHPAGRPYVTHEARHMTATLLLEAGVDPETIKAVLGHASIVTTRGYQHVSQQLAREGMEKAFGQLQIGN